MSKPQRLREEGQCAYCGQHNMLTIDHVIPRCLFDGVMGGVPGDVPRVGACCAVRDNFRITQNSALILEKRSAAMPFGLALQAVGMVLLANIDFLKIVRIEVTFLKIARIFLKQDMLRRDSVRKYR